MYRRLSGNENDLQFMLSESKDNERSALDMTMERNMTANLTESSKERGGERRFTIGRNDWFMKEFSRETMVGYNRDLQEMKKPQNVPKDLNP